MTLATNLHRRLVSIRAIPGKLGLRPYSVAAVNIDYGSEFTSGSTTTTAIAEADGQNPKVRWLNAEELTVGGFASGTIRVGPITPSSSAGGTLLSTLYRQPDSGDVARFKITGPEHPSGANYKLVDISTDRALRYMLTLERAP